MDLLDKLIDGLRAAMDRAAVLTTKTRKGIPAEKFAVPGKRKLPIHDCAHVRNAMARFGQTQGLTSEERRTAYNKILRAARRCGIDPSGFQKKFGAGK